MKLPIILAGLASVFIGAAAMSSNVLFQEAEPIQEEQFAEISPFFSYSAAEPGKTYSAAILVTVLPGWHVNSAAPFQDWLIPAELNFDTVAGLTPHDIVYPEGSTVILIGEEMSVYHDSLFVWFRITIDKSAPPGEIALPVSFTYQPCNDRECRAPQTARASLPVIIGEEGEPINEKIFAIADFASDAGDPSAETASEESDLERLIKKHGFWGYFIALGIAFITGVLLSFSPCTYPMIPITVSVFAGHKRSVGRGFILSLFYVGSMAVMYGIMGLIVSLVGGVFGAWLASPPVVIGIAGILVIFSLSMLGLYELNAPSSIRQKLGTAKTSGGVTGSIVLGVIAALVVSPCVGPFVAGILLYIATYGSPVIGFFTLFVFALGLGTLYIIIATFSSTVSALPGAGEWMDSVKKFFGFVLLMMAVYFLRTIMSPALTMVLAGLLLITFSIFGGGFDRLTSDAKFFQRLKKFLGMLAFIAGVYFLLSAILTRGFLIHPESGWFPAAGGSGQSAESKLIDWKTGLEEGLEQARLEGRPVLIDTWATWCANCRVLDKKTFGNTKVAAEAKRFVALRIQLEKANSPTTKEFMARFGLKLYSLPTTLLLDSDGKVRRILQGVVGPEEMIAEMRKID